MKLMNDGDTTSACQTSDDFRRENTAVIWSLPIYTMRKRDRQQGSKATTSNRICPPKTARQIRRSRDKKTQRGKGTSQSHGIRKEEYQNGQFKGNCPVLRSLDRYESIIYE
jgi:hypothetical protein